MEAPSWLFAPPTSSASTTGLPPRYLILNSSACACCLAFPAFPCHAMQPGHTAVDCGLSLSSEARLSAYNPTPHDLRGLPTLVRNCIPMMLGCSIEVIRAKSCTLLCSFLMVPSMHTVKPAGTRCLDHLCALRAGSAANRGAGEGGHVGRIGGAGDHRQRVLLLCAALRSQRR